MTNDITNSQCWTILKSLASKAGVEGTLSSKDVSKIMKAADTNNDGKISVDEFTSEAKKAVDTTEEQYLQAFKVISKNDGDEQTISDEDIEKAIVNFLNGSKTANAADSSSSGAKSKGGGGE